MRCSNDENTILANNVARIAIQCCLICAEIRNHASILMLLSITKADRGRDLAFHCGRQVLYGVDHECRSLAVAGDHNLG